MIEFLTNPTFIASFFSFFGGISLILLKNYTERHKNKSDLNSQLIENLWKEIGRLQEQINNLQNKESESEKREEELKKTIHTLQADNAKQTFEILQLRKEINDLRNDKKSKNT